MICGQVMEEATGGGKKKSTTKAIRYDTFRDREWRSLVGF